MKVRRSKDRGHFDHGWLDTYHTFSFADYQDPAFHGFRNLRVINEDRVQKAEGFGEHGHRDMEILTYVISGKLAHKDSMGTVATILPGNLQYMSAGKGVTHSEFNGSETETCHFMQIWIIPNIKGAEPRYGEVFVPAEKKRGRLALVAAPNVSPSEANEILPIRQDVKLYASILDSGKSVTHALVTGRHGWVQVMRGDVRVTETTASGEQSEVLHAGDGVALSEVNSVKFEGQGGEAEFLFFDLN